MISNRLFLFFSIIFLFLAFSNEFVHGQIEGIYCGKENCYSVLGVTRDDDRPSIVRAYRRMARVNHPDRQKTEEARAEAEIRFRKIVVAYDILRDEEQRREYDYMLDNPEAMYYHYYSYFKRRLGPQVDVRWVILVLITLASIAQYYLQYSSYHEALDYLVKQPRYRNEAKDLAKSAGLFANINKKKEKGKKVTKEDIRQQEEKILREVVAEKLNIKPFEVKRGSFYRPSVWNTLWVQIFTKPVWVVSYVCAWCRWILLYWILRREMSSQDKLEQIRWNLGTSTEVWKYCSDAEKDYYMRNELWIKEKYLVYAEKVADEERKRLADDPKYKRLQRFLRKGGPGQISFVEDVDFDFGG